LAEFVLIADIGTTTISGAILDRKRSTLVSTDAVLNRQAKFGEDLISRIDCALKSSSNALDLQKAVIGSVNLLLKRLLAKTSLKTKDIESAFFVSNTAVHHLFLGINTSPLITPPYRAAQKSAVVVYADRIGLKLKKNLPVTFLPNIGGFVGSDALAVIIATEIYRSRRISLAVDIGTNGEVILGNQDKILVASTAAGPAFEGRHISCGMPAIDGAIDRVSLTKRGNKSFKVIGNGPPKGICGSGLIDLAAGLLKVGIIDSSGRMLNERYNLYGRGKQIYMTQNDVRKMQIAKAAIYASIRVLVRKYGISQKDIKKIAITGSLGNTIKPENIAAIELIPGATKENLHFIKQGALEGLRLYLTNRSLGKKLTSILSKIRHIPLLGKSFAEEFTSSMGFK